MKKIFSNQMLCFIAFASLIMMSCKKDSTCSVDGTTKASTTPIVHDLTNIKPLSAAAARTGGDDDMIFGCASCDTTAPVFINSQFNGTPMAAYNYIWVNLHIKMNNYPAAAGDPLKIAMIDGSMDFTANGQLYHALMPDAQITFSDTASVANSVWNGTYWHCIIPRSLINKDEIFLDGLALPIPAGGFPGGIRPLKMTCTFKKNRTENVSLQWQWSAAVYTQFSMDYNDLNVKLIHTDLHAGTPINYESYVIGGAMGGGGSNYTGSWSSTGSASF